MLLLFVLLGLAMVSVIIWVIRQDVAPPEDPRNAGARIADRISHGERVLERVRIAAQTKMAGVELKGREDLLFAELSPDLDELDVMEVLLAVETEFDMEIPDTAITDRIGRENRRDLLHHLSLRELARVIEDLQAEPGP